MISRSTSGIGFIQISTRNTDARVPNIVDMQIIVLKLKTPCFECECSSL